MKVLKGLSFTADESNRPSECFIAIQGALSSYRVSIITIQGVIYQHAGRMSTPVHVSEESPFQRAVGTRGNKDDLRGLEFKCCDLEQAIPTGILRSFEQGIQFRIKLNIVKLIIKIYTKFIQSQVSGQRVI